MDEIGESNDKNIKKSNKTVRSSGWDSFVIGSFVFVVISIILIYNYGDYFFDKQYPNHPFIDKSAKTIAGIHFVISGKWWEELRWQIYFGELE